MAALRRLSALQVRVLRDGREQAIAARDLVPGDILLLAAGDAVGADARLIEEAAAAGGRGGADRRIGAGVQARGRPLPEATGLADRRNMVFSGTYVTAGRARAVVTATGTHTEVGGIARLTEGARGAEDAAGAAHRAVRPLPGGRRRWCCSSSWWRSACCAGCRSPTC